MTLARRARSESPTVYVVHSGRDGGAALRMLTGRLGCDVKEFFSAEAFLVAYRSEDAACLLIELNGSSLDGFDLLRRLREVDGCVPVIMLAERGSVPVAVRAMRAGATSVIERPCAPIVLMREIRRFLGGPTSAP